MAFPGTYNINYYKGDTFEFTISPKTSSNQPFTLNDYTQVRFTISNVLGPEVAGGPVKQTINAYATKVNNLNILCTIRPEDGALMEAGTTYYYDVEIAKISSPYDYVYTLLQGTITVAQETTLPAALPPEPTNLVLSNVTLTGGTISWTPPVTTIPIGKYNIYLVGQTLTLLGSVPSTQNTFTIAFPFQLPPNQAFLVAVKSENATGESVLQTAQVQGTTPGS